MTSLKGKEVEEIIPVEEVENAPVEEKPVDKPATFDEMLEYVDNKHKSIKNDFDEISDLRRRVQLTNQNLDEHISNVNSIENVLTKMYHGKKQEPKKLSKFKTEKKIIPSTIPKPQHKGNKNGLKSKIVQEDKKDSINENSKEESDNEERTNVLNYRNNDKQEIMGKLIRMTGRMVEFSENIEKGVLNMLEKLPIYKHSKLSNGIRITQSSKNMNKF